MEATKELEQIQERLEMAYAQLESMGNELSGDMQSFLQSRALIASQRAVIEKFKVEVESSIAKKERLEKLFKEQSIEYEKFNFLELEEIKKEIAQMKQKEQKALDEIAIQTFMRHKEDT